MNKKDLMTLRAFQKDEDQNFILSTWLKGLYHGNRPERGDHSCQHMSECLECSKLFDPYAEIPPDLFYATYAKVILKILELDSTIVSIACLKESEDVILGYSVISSSAAYPLMVHWVYVKHDWRKIGLLHDLLPDRIDCVTHLTKVGKTILKKNYATAIYNPFALSLKD